MSSHVGFAAQQFDAAHVLVTLVTAHMHAMLVVHDEVDDSRMLKYNLPILED